MIIAEVYVVALDKNYDFKLNENVPLSILAEEVCEMVCQKEQCRIEGDMENLLFCHIASRKILPMTKKLSELNIHTGEKLVLV